MLRSRYCRVKSSLSLFVPPVEHPQSLRRVFSTEGGKMLAPLLIGDLKGRQSGIDTDEMPNADLGDFFSSRALCLNQAPTHVLSLPSLPPIPKTTDPSFKDVMLQKIELCCQMCDFENPQNDLVAKDIKAKTLVELANSFIALGFMTHVDDEVKEAFIRMVKKNLLRESKGFDPFLIYNADAANLQACDWQHMQWVYKILLTFFKAFPKFHLLNFSFISDLIPIISSKDVQERDQVASVFAAYVHFFPADFQMLFSILAQKLIDHHEVCDPYAVYTCLLFFHTVCQNNTSLAKYVKPIFITHVVSLIGDNYMQVFQSPLLALIKQNLSESSMNVKKVLLAITNYWPITQPIKEEIILCILLKSLEYFDGQDLKLLSRAFAVIAMCCDNESFKIAEQANKALQTQAILDLITHDTKRFLFILFPHIERAKNHWSNNVRDAAIAAEKFIARLDPGFFTDKKTRLIDIQNNKLCTWASIARKAGKHDKSFNLADKLGELTKLYSIACLSQETTQPALVKKTIPNVHIVKPLIPHNFI